MFVRLKVIFTFQFNSIEENRIKENQFQVLKFNLDLNSIWIFANSIFDLLENQYCNLHYTKRNKRPKRKVYCKCFDVKIQWNLIFDLWYFLQTLILIKFINKSQNRCLSLSISKLMLIQLKIIQTFQTPKFTAQN